MRAVLFLAHGAGSDMENASMSLLAAKLAHAGFGVLRFNFLYSELQRGRPDTEETLIRTWIDVWDRGLPQKVDVPRLAGGRSMGGRMASLAAAKRAEAFRPHGLVFFAYPLHPPGQPHRLRTQHLDRIEPPLLFLSGTRDNFLSVELMENAVAPLPRATLHWLEGADHGFHVLKRSGRSDEDIVAEAVLELGVWFDRCVVSRDGGSRKGQEK
jgi:predicted alpha/beta-hydrolase family hydrolase